MKKLLLAVSVLVMSSSVFAKNQVELKPYVLEIEIPATDGVTELAVVKGSQTITHSGCSDSEVNLAVLKSNEADLFVVGQPIQVPTVLGLPDFGGPKFTCQAVVSTTTKFEFHVWGKEAKTVRVELPYGFQFQGFVRAEVVTLPLH